MHCASNYNLPFKYPLGIFGIKMTKNGRHQFRASKSALATPAVDDLDVKLKRLQMEETKQI